MKLSIIIKSCFLSNWTKLSEFLPKATKICHYMWFIHVWISHKTHSVKSTKFQKLPWQKCLILLIFSLKKGKHKWWVHMWHFIFRLWLSSLSNPLIFIEGSKWQFSPEIWSQITGGTNDFIKMAALWCYFYTEIGKSISKICWL